MRKASTHVALDKKPNRFTIVERPMFGIGNAIAVHDNACQTEHAIYVPTGFSRHNEGWTGLDVIALIDWLNDRAAGYPRNVRIPHACKVNGTGSREPLSTNPKHKA